MQKILLVTGTIKGTIRYVREKSLVIGPLIIILDRCRKPLGKFDCGQGLPAVGTF